MKKLLILFLFPFSLIAGDLRIVIIDYVPAYAASGTPGTDKYEPAKAEKYIVTAYGLQDKGKPTVTEYKSVADIKILRDIEGSADVSSKLGGVSPKRTVINYKPGGVLVEKVDLHIETANAFTTSETKPKAADSVDKLRILTDKIDPTKVGVIDEEPK